MRVRIFAASAFLAVCIPVSAFCAENDTNERLNRLDTELGRQAETIREQQKVIDELKQHLKEEVEKRMTTNMEQKADDGKGPTTEENASKPTGMFGGSAMTNPNISVVMGSKGGILQIKKKH